MNFDDTAQEAAFRREVRKWLSANVPREFDAAKFRPGMLAFDADLIRRSKEWQRKKFEAGWACPHWPKEYGGRGASAIEHVIWNQEEGVYTVLAFAFFMGHHMCGPTLMAYATQQQKLQHLPPMASGETVWCQLFSEPAAGSDLAGLRTRAERDGGDWVINGQKIWTSAAHFSDYAILLARTDATLPKHRGLTMFFLNMKSPGLEVRPIRQANGMFEFNEVFFTDVRIPDGQRLGGVNDGWSVSLTTLMNERQAVGPGNPIPITEVVRFFHDLETPAGRAIDDSAVRSKLADWAVRASGLKYTQYRSMTALSRNETPGPEESIGKLVAASTLQEMATCVLEQQGPAGVLASPAYAAANAYYQMILMRAAGTRIEGGSDEILRNIIGERVLSLPPDVRVDKNVPFNAIPTGVQRR